MSVGWIHPQVGLGSVIIDVHLAQTRLNPTHYTGTDRLNLTCPLITFNVCINSGFTGLKIENTAEDRLNAAR